MTRVAAGNRPARRPVVGLALATLLLFCGCGANHWALYASKGPPPRQAAEGLKALAWGPNWNFAYSSAQNSMSAAVRK